MENMVEIYMQIPEERRQKLRSLAKLLGNETEKEIRDSVVENWQTEQRIGEQHESER